MSIKSQNIDIIYFLYYTYVDNVHLNPFTHLLPRRLPLPLLPRSGKIHDIVAI
jgi:hypothetical protein